jgi:hypothetical protein
MQAMGHAMSISYYITLTETQDTAINSQKTHTVIKQEQALK